MPILTDTVSIGGREVPLIAIGAGVAAVGALITIVSRRSGPAAAEPSAPQTPGQVSELVTPDRLAAELATFGQGFEERQAAGLSGLSAQFQGLLGQSQADTAAQIAGVQSQLSGQYTGLQGQLTGQIDDLDYQLQATNQAVSNLTGRVAAVETKAQKIDGLTLAVRKVGSLLMRVITIAPTLADNTSQQAATYRVNTSAEVGAALQPIGGAILS